MRSLLLVESFDLRPSSQYILVKVIPSCFRFAKMLTILDLRNRTLGYSFHFQHRNSRTLPIEIFAHDSGRTLVCAEYGYPKESPHTNS
jgi:hypothetical protein